MGKMILYMAVLLGVLGIVFSLGVGMGMTMDGKRIAEDGEVCVPAASATPAPARSR